jgi:5-methylcytosine-specific restriction endonuclease McrA
MSTVTYSFAAGGMAERVSGGTAKVRRGYSSGRKAYDKRRRGNRLTFSDKEYKKIVAADPCAFCPSERAHDQIAVDHIEPLRDGGSDTWGNYTAACRVCNAAKGNKTMLSYLAGRN